MRGGSVTNSSIQDRLTAVERHLDRLSGGGCFSRRVSIPLVPLKTDGVTPLQITGCKIFPTDTISNRLLSIMHKYENNHLLEQRRRRRFVAEVPDSSPVARPTATPSKLRWSE